MPLKYIPHEIDKPLVIDDFVNPWFDKQKPVRRYMAARSEVSHLIEEDKNAYALAEEAYMMNPSDSNLERFMTPQAKQEPIIEGLTFTDNFHQVGYTYFLTDGMLWVNYWDKKHSKNIRLLEKPINSSEDFEKCIKQVDKKIQKLHK